MSENLPPMIKIILDQTVIIPHSKYHAAGINSVKYSPEGDFIVTGGSDDTIRIYDLSGNEIIFLEGHIEPVQSIDIHPTKKIIISGSEDSTARLWDLNLKKEIYRFIDAKNVINTVKFSLDGNKIITGGKDGILRVYDLESRLLQQEIKTGIITAIAQHPTRELVLVGTANSNILVIDIIKGTKILEIYGHRLPILSLEFSKDDHHGKEYLVSSSTDESVKIWDANTFDELLSFQAHSGAVHAVKFSPVNTSLATSSYDRSVAIWEVELESKQVTRKQHYYGAKLAFTDLDWSPDGKSLAIVSADGSLRVKSLVDNKDSIILEKNDTYITAMALSPDNKEFFLGLENGNLVTANLKGETVTTLENAHANTITCLSILLLTSDEFLVITGSTDKTIKIWQPKTLKLIAIGENHEGGIRSIAISPAKDYILTTSTDKTIRKYTLQLLLNITKNNFESNNTNKDEKSAKKIENQQEYIKDKTVLPSNVSTKQITGKEDTKNLFTQQANARTIQADNTVKDLTENPEEILSTQVKNNTPSTSDMEATTQLQKTATNRRKPSSRKRKSSKRAKKHVASTDASQKDDLVLEKIEKKKEKYSTFLDGLTQPIKLEEVKVYTEHKQSVNAVVFSHNGRYFATASNDYTIILYDINADIPMLTYKGHKDHVLSLMFSVDDELLYSGGKNGDIIIHATTTGKIVRTLNVHIDAVRAIVPCLTNKNYFATISDDNTSALFSIFGDKIGQICFATNPHTLVWDQNNFMYYISTEIGQLIMVKPIADEISYNFATLENLEIVLTKLILEVERIEKENEINVITLEQRLYWLNNRILLLEKIQEKTQDPKISELKRRLEEDRLKYQKK